MSLQVDAGGWSGPQGQLVPSRRGGGGPMFWALKRLVDIVIAIAMLPLFLVAAFVLLLLNPIYNPGPLFFVQDRMGRACTPFRVIKFRSMGPVVGPVRRAVDPLETHRITKLGHFIRKTRIDEWPQVLNVLRGDMSLIGPRPDAFDHACEFLEVIPHYARRHAVRPGLSGLAQVTLGYTEGFDATRAKSMRDLHYIRRAGFALEAKIIWLTFKVIFTAKGA